MCTKPSNPINHIYGTALNSLIPCLSNGKVQHSKVLYSGEGREVQGLQGRGAERSDKENQATQQGQVNITVPVHFHFL